MSQITISPKPRLPAYRLRQTRSGAVVATATRTEGWLRGRCYSLPRAALPATAKHFAKRETHHDAPHQPHSDFKRPFGILDGFELFSPLAPTSSRPREEELGTVSVPAYRHMSTMIELERAGLTEYLPDRSRRVGRGLAARQRAPACAFLRADVDRNGPSIAQRRTPRAATDCCKSGATNPSNANPQGQA